MVKVSRPGGAGKKQPHGTEPENDPAFIITGQPQGFLRDFLQEEQTGGMVFSSGAVWLRRFFRQSLTRDSPACTRKSKAYSQISSQKDKCAAFFVQGHRLPG
jgi:hypothetical protein